MRVYLDDTRPTPKGWVGARWPDEVIDLLKTGEVDQLSLDYDLGGDGRRTGNDVLVWIEDAVKSTCFQPPPIVIHSSNPFGRIRMAKSVKSIQRLVDSRCEDVALSTADDPALTTGAKVTIAGIGLAAASALAWALWPDGAHGKSERGG